MKSYLILFILLLPLTSPAVEDLLYDPNTSVLVCMHSIKDGEHVFKSKKLEWEDWDREDKVIVFQEWNHIIRGIHLDEQLDFGRPNVKVTLLNYHSNIGHWDDVIPIELSKEERKIKAHINYHVERGSKFWEREPRGLRTVYWTQHILSGERGKKPINVFTGLEDPLIDKVLLVPKSLDKVGELLSCAN